VPAGHFSQVAAKQYEPATIPGRICLHFIFPASSAAILSLLLWLSAGVHLLVHVGHVGVEHSRLGIVRLRDLLLGLGRQELMLRLVRRLLRGVTLLLSARFGHGVLGPALVLRLSVLTRYYVDEEVKHVGLAESGCNVATLQSATLVLLGVDPGAHGELGDEGLAGLGEDYGRFGILTSGSAFMTFLMRASGS
jgi:hypothetical protein